MSTIFATITLTIALALLPKDSNLVFTFEAGAWFIWQLWIIWISFYIAKGEGSLKSLSARDGHR